MRFLHIDQKNYNTSSNGNITPIDELNYYIEKKKDIIMLIYKEDCPPCMQTRPEWNKLKTNNQIRAKDIVIADIDHTLQKRINGLASNTISGYPTIRYMRGSRFEDFESWPNNKKQRDIDSFVRWIEYKVPSKPMRGGYKRRYNRNTKKHNKSTTRRRSKTRRIR